MNFICLWLCESDGPWQVVPEGFAEFLLHNAISVAVWSGTVYPNMPLASKGWKDTNAYFKQEGGDEPQINIGLGRGPGLNAFNDGIVGFDTIEVIP